VKIKLQNNLSDALQIELKVWVPKMSDYAIMECIFDTGASKTVIDTKLAELLGIQTIPAPDTLTAAGRVKTERGIVERIQIGERTISKVPVNIMPLPKELKARCLLGMNVLREYKVLINNRNKVISLTWNPLDKKHFKGDYSITAAISEAEETDYKEAEKP
jgi:hypothetical protein